MKLPAMPPNIATIHDRVQKEKVPLPDLALYLEWHRHQMAKHTNWRHKASGAVYVVTGVGLQNSSSDGCRVEVQYTPVDVPPGSPVAPISFHRSIDEFMDGRFEPVTSEMVWTPAPPA